MKYKSKIILTLFIIALPFSLFANSSDTMGLSNTITAKHTNKSLTKYDHTQEKTDTTKASKWKIFELRRKANDHLMFQFGYLMWLNRPNSQSIKTPDFPRTFSMYAMYDLSFHSNPHFSVALGAGVTFDNMFMSPKQVIDYSNPASRIDPFSDLSATNHFRKNKIVLFYLNIPAIEFRFISNPQNPNRAFKFSIGGSYGWLLNSYTKGVALLNGNGDVINNAKIKYVSNRFLANSRVLLNARIGWGPVSAFVTYQPTSIFTSTGPSVQAITIGLTLSAL